jgi:hypothetical protein
VRRLALFLSVAGHPFVLVPLTLLAVTRHWVWPAVIAASSTLPMLGIIARRVRRGTWSDYDVSRHEQRSGLYHVAFPLLAVTALVLYLMDAPAGMLRGVAAGAAMLAAGFLANRWLKVSAHMMFAAFCGVLVAHAIPAAALPALALVAAVAWSRRALDRHTWPEIVTGAIFGAIAGMIA